jgi:hypothetical protein
MKMMNMRDELPRNSSFMLRSAQLSNRFAQINLVLYCARFKGLTTLSRAVSAPERKRGFFVSACFVGWLCEYNTRKGNSMGRALGGCHHPTI